MTKYDWQAADQALGDALHHIFTARRYIKNRKRANAMRSIVTVEHATARAFELLESAVAVVAVDPHVADSGKQSTVAIGPQNVLVDD